MAIVILSVAWIQNAHILAIAFVMCDNVNRIIIDACASHKYIVRGAIHSVSIDFG